MPEFVVRGKINFPFEASVEADSVTMNFDLFAHYGVAERYFGASAWEDDGPLSDPGYGVTIDDANSSVSIESVGTVEWSDALRVGS